MSFVTVIGATTALFMAFLGIVQNDIKRVVAYSTLSQLGYMTVALGVSAYSAAIFHLMTHAFFKALLFLGAGLGDHRAAPRAGPAQDGRAAQVHADHLLDDGDRLAGARAAFRRSPASSRRTRSSRRSICSTIPGHGYAYFAVMAGVFVTAFYSFRMLFLAFHGKERFGHAAHEADGDTHAHDASHERRRARHACDHGGPPKESPWVVTVPLILLAIPSVYAGWAYIEPMLFGDYFGNSIVVRPSTRRMAELKEEWHGVGAFIAAWRAEPAVLARARRHRRRLVLLSRQPGAAGAAAARRPAPLYTLLDNKYYFDRFNDWFFAGGARALGALPVERRRPLDHRRLLRQRHRRVVGWTSALLRHMQSGYVYHYAFTMIVGLFALLSWWTL